MQSDVTQILFNSFIIISILKKWNVPCFLTVTPIFMVSFSGFFFLVCVWPIWVKNFTFACGQGRGGWPLHFPPYGQPDYKKEYFLRPIFFVGILVIRAKHCFLLQISNTRPTKELKSIFAFAKSLPTSTTLLDADLDIFFRKNQFLSSQSPIINVLLRHSLTICPRPNQNKLSEDWTRFRSFCLLYKPMSVENANFAKCGFGLNISFLCGKAHLF